MKTCLKVPTKLKNLNKNQNNFLMHNITIIDYIISKTKHINIMLFY